MAAPETQNARTVAGDANAYHLIVTFNRIGFPLVVFAACGLVLAAFGLFTDRLYVALTGVGIVAAGALGWTIAGSIIALKMAGDWFKARRKPANQSPVPETETP